MNYWVLISLFTFVFLFESLFPAKVLLPDHQFVEIDQSQEWEIFPGEKKNLEITINILEGYHIQADQVMDDNLIPTRLTIIEVPPNMVVYDPIFPHPESFKFKDVQDSMMVFHNTLRIGLPVEAKNEAKIGQHKIAMNLQYQACDSIKCYFPREIHFMILVAVKKMPLSENE